MKICISFIICLLMGYNNLSEPEVKELRKLFYAAEGDKSAYVKLTKAVSKVDAKSPAVFVCYKGVAEMMGAKYTFNPLNKLSKFRKGKALIEEAVKMAPDDLEIRFLRFSIQTNLPGFLGYDEHIVGDRMMLMKNASTISDNDLKIKVIQYLSSSRDTSEEVAKN